jgi:ribosomal protein L13E
MVGLGIPGVASVTVGQNDEPIAGYGFSRLDRSIRQQPDYFGRTQSVPSAALSTILGLKTTPVDVRQERGFRLYEFEKLIEDLDREGASLTRNRGLSVEEKRRRLGELMNKKRQLTQEYRERISP